MKIFSTNHQDAFYAILTSVEYNIFNCEKVLLFRFVKTRNNKFRFLFKTFKEIFPHADYYLKANFSTGIYRCSIFAEKCDGYDHCTDLSDELHCNNRRYKCILNFKLPHLRIA